MNALPINVSEVLSRVMADSKSCKASKSKFMSWGNLHYTNKYLKGEQKALSTCKIKDSFLVKVVFLGGKVLFMQFLHF